MNDQWALDTGLPFIENEEEWERLCSLYEFRIIVDRFSMTNMIEYALLPRDGKQLIALQWMMNYAYGPILGFILV
jgi:hypothetical protein